MTARPTPLRLLRASAFALAVVALALLAHRAGGATLPGAGAIAGGAAATVAVAFALAGRRRTPRAIGALVATSQLALHALWELAGSEPASIVGCVAHDTGSALGTAAMATCHALAALAVAILLERGERWAFATLRVVRRAARSLRRAPGARATREPRASRVRALDRALPAWRVPLAGGRSTCGPPASA